MNKTINLFPISIHQIDVDGFDEVKNNLINYIYNLKKITIYVQKKVHDHT